MVATGRSRTNTVITAGRARTNTFTVPQFTLVDTPPRPLLQHIEWSSSSSFGVPADLVNIAALIDEADSDHHDAATLVQAAWRGRSARFQVERFIEYNYRCPAVDHPLAPVPPANVLD
eukprot:3358590-Prymnesium_polylepis.1